MQPIDTALEHASTEIELALSAEVIRLRGVEAGLRDTIRIIREAQQAATAVDREIADRKERAERVLTMLNEVTGEQRRQAEQFRRTRHGHETKSGNTRTHRME